MIAEGIETLNANGAWTGHGLVLPEGTDLKGPSAAWSTPGRRTISSRTSHKKAKAEADAKVEEGSR